MVLTKYYSTLQASVQQQKSRKTSIFLQMPSRLPPAAGDPAAYLPRSLLLYFSPQKVYHKKKRTFEVHMKTVEIIPETAFRTTSWSGGTTTELFIWPEGSSYPERRFSARISTALVELEESSFTPLPGVKRFLTPLCAGFSLTVNGESVKLPHGQVLEFSGGDDVTCRGSGRDLNLMLKGCGGEMRIVRGAFKADAPMAFLYSERGARLRPARWKPGACRVIPAGAFVRLAPGEYGISESAVLFVIRPR